MKIETYTPQSKSYTHFNGNLLAYAEKKINKLLTAPEIITKDNQELINRTLELGRKMYNQSPSAVTMNVKNGNKELSVVYNNSSYHRVTLKRKGEITDDFEILHPNRSNEFSFYSTGSYQCKIIDEKFIKKYNDILANWLPRLNKQLEKSKKA